MAYVRNLFLLTIGLMLGVPIVDPILCSMGIYTSPWHWILVIIGVPVIKVKFDLHRIIYELECRYYDRQIRRSCGREDDDDSNLHG